MERHGHFGQPSDPGQATCYLPADARHARRLTRGMNFGSAHAVSFNMAFCDGPCTPSTTRSTRNAHHRLGNIADGRTIDAKKSDGKRFD